MRRLTRVVLVAGFLLAAHWADAGEGVAEVIRLAKSGMGEEVLVEFVKSSNLSFDMSTDEILMLNDLGVSEKVIGLMISRGKIIRGTDITDTRGAPGNPLGTEPPATPATGGPDTSTDAAETTSVPPPVAPESKEVDITYFYDTLSPYGTWVEVPDHGWCWQPTSVVVDANWRPYYNRGRWIWTDAGWYWQSGYSWGWSTFHYGRWHYDLRHRWVWSPDTVWGPAWVHWRASDTYVGWAPLPPRVKVGLNVGLVYEGKDANVGLTLGLRSRDFVFVATGGLMSPNLIPVAVPRTQVTTVYSQTTVIKNTYVTQNKTIVHRGIPVERVSRAAKYEIRPVQLETRKVVPGRPVTGALPRDRQLPVYRPQVRNVAPRTPPEVVRERQRAIEKRQKVREEERRTPRVAPPPVNPKAIEKRPPVRTEGQKTPRVLPPSSAQQANPAATPLPQPVAPSESPEKEEIKERRRR